MQLSCRNAIFVFYSKESLAASRRMMKNACKHDNFERKKKKQARRAVNKFVNKLVKS